MLIVGILEGSPVNIHNPTFQMFFTAIFLVMSFVLLIFNSLKKSKNKSSIILHSIFSIPLLITVFIIIQIKLNEKSHDEIWDEKVKASNALLLLKKDSVTGKIDTLKIIH